MDEFRRKPVNKLDTAEGAPASVPVNSPVNLQETTQPTTQPASQPSVAPHTPQPLEEVAGLNAKPPKKSKKKFIISTIIGIVVAIGLAIAALFTWYSVQLSPVDSANENKELVVIESGSTPTAIATTLEEKELIRSADAFLWYTRLNGVQNSLQAGSYRLSQSESTPEIVEHLTKGNVDTFNVTLYPGATLVDNTDKDPSKKLDVTSALKRAGYTDEEIKAGLAADYSAYNDTLFQNRPAGTDLEGYIYGETYQLSSGASVEDVLKASFDEFWKVIEANGLIAKYEAQGLNLYEGITLASIVQREASIAGDDMPQITQVFYTRLAQGMPLGSDVTYQYVADKTGVARDTNLDSPYNTRRYAGLPPGPIASPGKKALLAVATPAEGDYLYFLSGDDDVTYFARTLEEHEANIVNHCQQKCQIL